MLGSLEQFSNVESFWDDIQHYFTSSFNAAKKARQQGDFESIYSDMNIAFANWEFGPMDLATNPIDGSVHLWQGAEDLIVSVSLSRYISQKLPWIQYHELQNAGHLFPLADGMTDIIVKALVTGDQ
ncbi:uncharacterized protein A4U43_C04F6780 [Asparagus officinalis]|uniref:AB hydrolase-1 domain-containing protein n=1 Tax=Asparagus officinalis TaxID=4686 RepID=A0A5P1F0L9_ASPOF|nr:uncharacterized protein A4U43_C04F6780 [Asparagus officinalis]